ncbi:hypothetical protein [Pseudaquabacterium pictum]|uniref:Fimbrial assembly protein n=1 Tax=Pseudaquabacterium pictum TaxID=2315236 RepID=A0A480AS68_9BURK|nr:hypothetical protein [Rubrivivax pictus]GCL62902.1 hypothetical protein AQPW35_19830 [Rubrivivax pictus]
MTAARWPRPDFLRPAARAGRLAWAWCATGLLVLAAAGLEGQTAWAERQQALQRQARAAQQPAASARGPASGDATRRSAEATQRAAEAARWAAGLAQPWPAVWAASETAPASVQWLQLAHGPGGGLRLSGLASDPAAAQAAAQALHQQAPWQGVTLASIERLPEGQRFELVARLAGDTRRPAP